jgi:hypothetical protein
MGEHRLFSLLHDQGLLDLLVKITMDCLQPHQLKDWHPSSDLPVHIPPADIRWSVGGRLTQASMTASPRRMVPPLITEA